MSARIIAVAVAIAIPLCGAVATFSLVMRDERARALKLELDLVRGELANERIVRHIFSQMAIECFESRHEAAK